MNETHSAIDWHDCHLTAQEICIYIELLQIEVLLCVKTTEKV